MTLLDDGFKSVHFVSETLSAGGIWALDDSGMSYPGLLTNSGIGDYEYSTGPMVEDPDFLKNNEDRISGAAVGRYLEEFYERFVKGRATSVRFGHRVLLMDRVPSETSGWKLDIQSISTDEVFHENWDKVVLSIGISATIKMPYCFADSSAVDSFQGILTHSSKVNAKLHERILNLGPAAKIVVIGGGKSAVDLAQLYGGLGRDTTIAFRKAKLFGPGDKTADTMILTRVGATLTPPQHPRTRLERFLHRTSLGAFLLRQIFKNMISTWMVALKIAIDSPLYYSGSHSMLYFGPADLGGRAMSYERGFHTLASEGKIKVVAGAELAGIYSDGRGVVLKDGRTFEADVIICATGFGQSLTFIPEETKKSLGLALELPYSTSNPYEGLTEFTSLQPVPAPPRSDPATHVYRGILPAGALESRDLVVCGGAWALKAPFISELSSHWISSFFLGSSHLNLPPSNEAAFSLAEDHAQWIRARYPNSAFYWEKLYYCAWLNTDQYFEDLFGDMGVKTERREKGFFGLGFYLAKLLPSSIKDLGEERRALRVAAGEE